MSWNKGGQLTAGSSPATVSHWSKIYPIGINTPSLACCYLTPPGRYWGSRESISLVLEVHRCGQLPFSVNITHRNSLVCGSYGSSHSSMVVATAKATQTQKQDTLCGTETRRFRIMHELSPLHQSVWCGVLHAQPNQRLRQFIETFYSKQNTGLDNFLLSLQFTLNIIKQ